MPKRSILLIEHESSLREILQVSLNELGGLRVIQSNSIQEATNFCATSHPDAILLDASTAETDALIFVEQLKLYSMSKAIPILLLTARANWFTERQMKQMGFAGAINKPFNPSTISIQISQLLGWNHET